MIFGKTYAEQDRLNDAKQRVAREWQRSFAWAPTTLMNGQTAWLEFVMRRNIGSFEYPHWVYIQGESR